MKTKNKRKLSLMLCAIIILQVILPIASIVKENFMANVVVAKPQETPTLMDLGGGVVAKLETEKRQISIVKEYDGNGIITKDEPLQNYQYNARKEEWSTLSDNYDEVTFDNALFYKVYIGNGVKNISEKLFYYMTFVEQIIGGRDIERIEKEAFRGCYSLQIIECDNVEYIEEKAFKDCSTLKQIGDSNLIKISVLGDKAFENCKSLEFLHISGAGLIR